MSRRGRAAGIVALGAIAWLVLSLIDSGNTSADLAVLAAGIVLGELLVLRLEDRSAVPLSFAVMFVLASSFAADEFVGVVLGAELVAFFVVPRRNEPMGRVRVLVNRLVVGGATLLVYRGVAALFSDGDSLFDMLAALMSAAAAQVLADTVVPCRFRSVVAAHEPRAPGLARSRLLRPA